MTQLPPRCSDTARERGDDPVGTAAPARRWLLVEHPGPWRVNAWVGSGIADNVRRALDEKANLAGARILLIRRPGRGQGIAPARWAVVGGSSRSPWQRWGTWQDDDDLLDALPVLGGPDPADSDPARPDAAPDAAALLLVCTHGRHDMCCAIRGRPVAAALQRLWPSSTWECSHVGGDRFAANLVVLPDGAYYGNLDGESAVRVVRDHLAGRVSVDHLRGLSSERPVAQAAVAAAHRVHGPAAPSAFVSTDVRQVASGRWEVELNGEPPGPASLLVTVETRAGPPARLTCRAARATTPVCYEAVDIREPGSP